MKVLLRFHRQNLVVKNHSVNSEFLEERSQTRPFLAYPIGIRYFGTLPKGCLKPENSKFPWSLAILIKINFLLKKGTTFTMETTRKN